MARDSKVYSDSVGLGFAITQDAKDSMDKLTDEMWNDLKDMIDVNVYNHFTDKSLYERTNQFKESWQWDNLDTDNLIKRSLYSHAEDMRVIFEENGWVAHGSVFPKGIDMREALDVILNEEPWDGSFIDHKIHGSYWNEFRGKWTEQYITDRFWYYMSGK